MGKGSLVGSILSSTYRLVRQIGEGGMGAVYEAQHLRLGKRVAVKVLLKEILRDEEAYKRFRREAEITSNLGHPGIVEVTDFDHSEDGWPFMVMEYLEGEDLGAILDRMGTLSVQQTVSLIGEVGSALQAAHDQGIIHRDLKPPNIFLCRFGDRRDFPKILDFGISKIRGSTSIATKSQSYLGTPFYMAPEQAEGRSAEADARTDIFALGAIIYRMLAGQDAFAADTLPAVLYKIVHTHPEPLCEVNPLVDKAVADVVRQTLSKDPDGRFSSVADLVEALAKSAGQSARAGSSGESGLNIPVGDEIDAPTIEDTRPAFLPALSPDEEERRPVAPGTRLKALPLRAVAAIVSLLVIGAALAAVLFLRADTEQRPSTALAESAAQPLRFGLVSYLPKDMLSREQRALVGFFSGVLKRRVELKLEEDFVDLADRLASGKLEIAALSAYNYVRAKRRFPALALLATHITSSGRSYQGHIISREESGFKSLQDLKGRVFCYVSPTSSSGYLFPRALFMKNRIDPDRFFKATRFTGQHASALKALDLGACDGAAVFAGIFQEAPAGKYTILAKTAPVPYDAYVVAPGFPRDLTASLRNALLTLEPGSEAARTLLGKTSRIKGFVPAKDADYDQVRWLERYLDADDAKQGK